MAADQLDLQDTGWESGITYTHSWQLTAELDGVMPIRVVRKAQRDSSTAHICDDAVAVVTRRIR